MAFAAVLLVAAAYLREAALVPTEGIDALNFHLPVVAQVDPIGVDVGDPPVHPGPGARLLPPGRRRPLPLGDAAARRRRLRPARRRAAACDARPRAVRAGGRARGAAVGAVSFAALFVSIPVVIQPALQETMPDSFMLACLAAGVLFGLSYLRTTHRSELVLCGIGLGLAAGTKWYGASSVIALTVAAGVALLVARRPRGKLAGELALLVGVMAVAGGFWFVRNAIASGNPVFPIEVAPLGITIFDAPRDTIREMAGFAIADYATDGEAWSTYLLPALWRTLRAPVLVAAAGLALSLTLAIRRLRASRAGRSGGAGGADRAAARTVFLGLAALLLAGVYVITPYSALGPEGMPVQADANVRYLLPAILIATALGAAAFSSLPWGVRRRPGDRARRDRRRARKRARAELSSVAQAAAVLLVAGAVAMLAVRLSRRGRRRLSVGLAGAAAAAAGVLTVAAGREVQERIDTAPYRGVDPALDRVLVRSDARVALTGEWDNAPPAPPFPAFGPELDNDVTYAGPFVEDMLRRYRDPDSFLRRLSQERPDLLLVGRSGKPSGAAREAGWARRDGWRTVAESPRFLVLARGTELR